MSHKVVTPGALATIVCFFLPWILVSCGGQPLIELSGWQMAAGTTLRSAWGTPQNVPGTPILFVVLLAGIAALALVYFASRRGQGTSLDSPLFILLGVSPLLVMFLQFSGMQTQTASSGFTVEFRPGLWGVIGGSIVVVIGGWIGLQRKS